MRGTGTRTKVFRPEPYNGSLAGPRLQIAICDTKARNFGVKGPVALRTVVDDLAAQGSSWVKLFGDLGWDDPPQYSWEELTAVVDEAHRKGMKVAIHSIGPEDNHRSVEARVDSIDHGIDIRDEDLRRTQSLGTYFVPTMTVLRYVAQKPGTKDRAVWSYQLERSVSTFKRALRFQVRIAFGTDAGAEGAPGWTATPAEQLRLMVENGMTPRDAIQSATQTNAALLGMEREVGSIEVGKFADIIAVSGDPLQDISRLEHVEFVMKNGQRYK